MQNLSAIVWLYRGQQKRFLALVKQYLARMVEESTAVEAELAQFETTLADVQSRFDTLTSAVANVRRSRSSRNRASPTPSPN